MDSDITGAIVAGIDGSDHAVRAARWAAAVASAYGAGLHIVHAMPSFGRNLSETAAAIRAAIASYQEDSSQIFLSAAADAVRADFPALSVTTESAAVSADEALVQASAHARLVVLGSNEVTPASALLLGSTTLATATHARCPVVVWRGADLSPSDQPVVVGVDDTPAAAAALTAAFEFADRFGAPLRAVRSWSSRLPPGAPRVPFLIDWEALETAQVVALTDLVDEYNKAHPGVEAKCFVEMDSPGGALMRHAEAAQLVIVGTRGRNALTSTLLGSTSLNMLQHSPIPVMVCREASG